MAKNHYQTLGVAYNAPSQDIKKAFRSLAICYHPDVTRLDRAAAEERFKEISEAYCILKDPERRREYDRTLPAPPRKPRIICSPPSWEYEAEEWIWDERQLRYRRKATIKDGEYEARAPFSSAGRGVRYRPKSQLYRLRKRGKGLLNSSGSWLARRARNTRLWGRQLIDRVFTRRLRAWQSKRPHKILKVRST